MKDKNIAGVLALFLGTFGIHRFYLGQGGLGMVYLLTFWTGIPALIGVIDALLLFTMNENKFDFKYNQDYIRMQERYSNRQRQRPNDTDFERTARQRKNNNTINPRTQYQNKKQTKVTRKIANPYKQSAADKYKDFDYDGAIAEYEKALTIDPNDKMLHFEIARAYSLTEQAEQALHHLDKAVANGFNDFQRIKEEDALAFLRIQEEFDEFERNGFRLVSTNVQSSINTQTQTEQNLLSTRPDLLDQLKKLGELRERGILTDEEFVKEKRKLLG